jgi:hypothetical protein
MTCCGKAKKIANKGKNIIKGFTALAMGKKYEFTAGRLSVCRVCPDNYWIAKTLWCKICKCNLEAKARVEDEKCPKDKWDK